MMFIYLEAPFAAFRTFTAGWYRPTAKFITPSAAYGLVLNIAGIETRLREEEEDHPKDVPASRLKFDLPKVELALGAAANGDASLQLPTVQSMFQQLHNYPVGATGKASAESCWGNKYNITPVRREFLSNLRAVIAIRGNTALETQFQDGLAGAFNLTRYGIPFMGDNAFLLDQLKVLTNPIPVFWYSRVSEGDRRGVNSNATRLTMLVDRGDTSQTSSALFAPCETAVEDVPENAWVEILPPTKPVVAKKGSRK